MCYGAGYERTSVLGDNQREGGIGCTGGSGAFGTKFTGDHALLSFRVRKTKSKFHTEGCYLAMAELRASLMRGTAWHVYGVALLLFLALGATGFAQSAFVADYEGLASSPLIQEALSYIQSDHDHRVQETLELVAIPAPPFNEHVRAAEFARRLSEIGLEDVSVDAEGNVISYLRGTRGSPLLVLSAHLDTVFPPGYDPTPHIDANGVIHAPGIADDTAGLTALLSIARAFINHGITPVGDIMFMGTVGEEGRGDLRGVKYLFASNSDIDGFISVDGTGSGRISYLGLGSKRYEFHFTGPGGHSWGAFGLPSPIHAMGRAIAKIADMQVPSDPRTNFNVGVVGGGTSVNSIAAQAVMQTDNRSASPEQLQRTVDEVLALVRVAVAEENARAGQWVIDVQPHLVGDRPSGTQSVDSPMVQAAFASATVLPHSEPALGHTPGSTDSNVPISLGVPAVTIGSGGLGRDAHAPHESWDPVDAWHGVQYVFLTVAGAVGVDGISEPLLPEHPGYSYKFEGLPFIPEEYIVPGEKYSFSWIQLAPQAVEE